MYVTMELCLYTHQIHRCIEGNIIVGVVVEICLLEKEKNDENNRL